MDDRDFLGYFTKLGNPKVDGLKQAANNIVNTLLALESKMGRKASIDSSDKTKQKVEESLRKKYQSGDLGEGMSSDLNYTLKRLVRGLYSENHAVKQGFFVASVAVLTRFHDQIDFEKYLEFVLTETKTNASMKNPEVHSLMLGRMMCISAVLESGWITSQGKRLVAAFEVLIEIYQQQEFLREPIQVVFKLLNTKAKNFKAFEQVAKKLLLADKKEKELEAHIMSSSSSFSLFLQLKETYSSHFSGQSKEMDKVMATHLLSKKGNLIAFSKLVQAQTYLYPRLHSCVSLAVNELFHDKKHLESNLL